MVLTTVYCFASYLALPEIRYNSRSRSLNLKWCLLLLNSGTEKITVHSYERASSSWTHATCASYDEEGLMMAWITLGWHLPPPRLGWLSGKVKPGRVTFSMVSQRLSAAMKCQGWGAALWPAGGWRAAVWYFHRLFQIKEEDTIRNYFCQINQCLLMTPCQPLSTLVQLQLLSWLLRGWTSNI